MRRTRRRERSSSSESAWRPLSAVPEDAGQAVEVFGGGGELVGVGGEQPAGVADARRQQPAALQVGGLLGGQEAGVGGRLQRRQGPGRAQGRERAAVAQLQQLHGPLDVGQAAGAELHVAAGRLGPVRRVVASRRQPPGGAEARAGGTGGVEAAGRGRRAAAAVAPRSFSTRAFIVRTAARRSAGRRVGVDDRGHAVEERLRELAVAGHVAGLGQGLELPVLGPALVVGEGGLEGAGQRAVAALGAQTEVDAEGLSLRGDP